MTEDQSLQRGANLERKAWRAKLHRMLRCGYSSAREALFERQARAAGIAPATLRRAKTVLGIKPKKAGFEKGWTWKLLDRRCSSNPEDAHQKGMSAFDENERLRTKDGWEEI